MDTLQRRYLGRTPHRQGIGKKLAAALLCVCISSALSAQTYTVGGVVNGVGASTGLQLRLDATFICLQDNHYFTLNGTTQTSACFASESKCCSENIKSTASDGVSTVSCTCGNAVLPRPAEIELAPATSETIAIPAHATSFQFKMQLSPTSPYVVSVARDPEGPVLLCGVANSDGDVATANVSNVKANCVDRIFKTDFEAALIIFPPPPLSEAPVDQ
jgi:hypothetical protein